MEIEGLEIKDVGWGLFVKDVKHDINYRVWYYGNEKRQRIGWVLCLDFYGTKTAEKITDSKCYELNSPMDIEKILVDALKSIATDSYAEYALEHFPQLKWR